MELEVDKCVLKKVIINSIKQEVIEDVDINRHYVSSLGMVKMEQHGDDNTQIINLARHDEVGIKSGDKEDSVHRPHLRNYPKKN